MYVYIGTKVGIKVICELVPTKISFTLSNNVAVCMLLLYIGHASLSVYLNSQGLLNPVMQILSIFKHLRSQRQGLDTNLEPNKQKISLGCLIDLMEKTEEFLKDKYKEVQQKETDTEQIEYDKDTNAQNDTVISDIKNAELNSNEEITNNMKNITEELQESKSLFSAGRETKLLKKKQL